MSSPLFMMTQDSPIAKGSGLPKIKMQDSNSKLTSTVTQDMTFKPVEPVQHDGTEQFGMSLQKTMALAELLEMQYRDSLYHTPGALAPGSSGNLYDMAAAALLYPKGSTMGQTSLRQASIMAGSWNQSLEQGWWKQVAEWREYLYVERQAFWDIFAFDDAARESLLDGELEHHVCELARWMPVYNDIWARYGLVTLNTSTLDTSTPT